MPIKRLGTYCFHSSTCKFTTKRRFGWKSSRIRTPHQKETIQCYSSPSPVQGMDGHIHKKYTATTHRWREYWTNASVKLNSNRYAVEWPRPTAGSRTNFVKLASPPPSSQHEHVRWLFRTAELETKTIQPAPRGTIRKARVYQGRQLLKWKSALYHTFY